MKFLLSLMLIFTCLLSFGQPDFRFHTYDMSDGLPSPAVNDFVEDSFGQIWMGTGNGLVSFNGYEFTVFRKLGNLHAELITNEITRLFMLPTNDLLVGTSAGLYYFDHRKQKFRSLWDKLPNSYISSIISDGKQGFWIGSSTGLYYMSAVGSLVKPVFLEDQSPLYNTGIFDVYGHQQTLWITTSRKGFFKFDVATNKLTNYRNKPEDTNSLSSNTMRQLAALPDGRLILGTADAGYNVFDPKTETFVRLNHDPRDSTSLSSTSAFSILPDSKGNLWIGTWANGLNRIDTATWRGRYFKNNPDNKYSVCSNSIVALFESSSGDIWIGSVAGGASRLTPRDQKFYRYRHNAGDPNSLTSPFVRSIHVSAAGTIWFGTNQGGLNRFDPSTNRYTVYLKPDGSRETLSRGTIWSISEARDGNLWFGTSRGVGRWERDSEKISFLEYDSEGDDPRKLSGNNVLKVLDDQAGSLWVGIYYGGLNRVNTSTGVIDKYRHDEKDPLSLSSDEINDIFIDSRKRIWIACDNGLNLFDPVSKTFKHFLNDSRDPAIVHLNEAPSGELYLGTSQGLGIFRLEDETVKFVGEAQGLIADHVNSVLVDQHGLVWLGTNNGIDRYDPATEKILHITLQHGLNSNDTDAKSCFMASDGTLYFGGTNGATAFKPDEVFSERGSDAVLFTGLSILNKAVSVNDTSVLTKSMQVSKNITLNYTDYIFAIDFSAVRFDLPGYIHYTYMLEGFDKNWINSPGVQRKAVYTNVPAGTYRLLVKASNSLGEFTSPPAEIEIIITPPWWKTWWAQLGLYTIILILILLFIRMRTAFIKRQNLLLEEQVAERTAEVLLQKETLELQAQALEKANHQKSKLFSIISHDLRSPVNSLSSVLPLLDRQLLTSDEIHSVRHEIGKRLEDVSDAMNNLLTWASTQLDEERLKPEVFDINWMVDEMIVLYSPIAEKKNISLVTVHHQPLNVWGDLNMVRAILRNLINNAIKFTTTGGTITVLTQTADNEVMIQVIDTGVGMDDKTVRSLFSDQSVSTTGTSGERGIGLGLQLVAEFVAKLHGRIWVTSEPGVGTTFSFTLPVNANS